MEGFNFEAAVKIVADSPEQIRRCDLLRLIESVPAAHRAGMADFLTQKRPELAAAIDAAYVDADEDE